jgi:hypothetical protein
LRDALRVWVSAGAAELAFQVQTVFAFFRLKPVILGCVKGDCGSAKDYLWLRHDGSQLNEG